MVTGRPIFQRNYSGSTPPPVLVLRFSLVLVVGILCVVANPYTIPSLDHILLATTTKRAKQQQPPPPAVAAPKNNDNETQAAAAFCWDRPPPIWPRSFVVTQKVVPDTGSKVAPATTVTYYDSEQGANLIQNFPDDGNDDDVFWDLELNTGQSFYFKPSQKKCTPVHFPVGILRRNWLEGASPLGPEPSTWRRSTTTLHGITNTTTANNRVVCGWTKLDFIDYYADAETGIPDSWYFYTMRASFRVLDYYTTASVNANNSDGDEHAAIDPALFVPPDYCFPPQ